GRRIRRLAHWPARPRGLSLRNFGGMRGLVTGREQRDHPGGGSSGIIQTPGEGAVAARISQKVAVAIVFVAAMFMSILDATIVNTALPTIGRDFGVSPTAVGAISIAYLVSLAVTIPA